jgi:tetratricopeptide (TPR) repeat protein
VLLHAACAVLAWRLLDGLAVPGAWIAAALFAVHPVHVESVAWITERKNVLSGVFYLAAALLYVTRARDDARAYAGVVALYVLALLSKSVTATLPLALAIALWWRDGTLRAADVRRLATMLAIGVAAGLLTVWMERTRVGAVGPYWDQTFAERCLIAGRALWFYAGKLVWPDPLAFSYERWTLDATSPAQWLWPLAAVAAAGIAWRVDRGVFAALAIFVVTLAPALGFLNVYPMRYSFVADHFQYLASLAILALVSAALVRVARERALAAGAVVLAAFVTLTARQTLAYRDLETLWTSTLAANPRSVLALQNLGSIEYARERFPEALALYERARGVEPEQPDVWNGIGLAQLRLGRVDDAEAAFAHALRADPRHAEAARNLGALLATSGRPDEAIAAYERAIAAAPDMVEAREDLAIVLVRAGRPADAEAQLREVLRIDPRALRARVQLGGALVTEGRWRDALAAYDAAVQLAPRSIDGLAGRAEALAVGGDFPAAIVAADRAREVARQDGRTSAVSELDRRLASYRAGTIPSAR